MFMGWLKDILEVNIIDTRCITKIRQGKQTKGQGKRLKDTNLLKNLKKVS